MSATVLARRQESARNDKNRAKMRKWIPDIEGSGEKHKGEIDGN